MFQSCGQIQDWIGWEGCYLICNPSQLSIASYFNNMKSTKHIHLVYLVHHGKADHPAIHHKEDMSIDKEDIDANADLLLELN
jgi:hypothetical protein